LPEGAPEDGVDRGIAAFVICASLVRQFEFVQNVWANDPNFHELGNEHNPMIGAQDGTFDFTIPKRPIRKRIKGLPDSRPQRAVPSSSFRVSKRFSTSPPSAARLEISEKIGDWLVAVGQSSCACVSVGVIMRHCGT
jgi:hypothetical protein